MKRLFPLFLAPLQHREQEAIDFAAFARGTTVQPIPTPAAALEWGAGLGMSMGYPEKFMLMKEGSGTCSTEQQSKY